MRYRCYLVMGWVLVSAACSSNDDSGAGPDAGVNSAGPSITCTIDGVSWTSNQTTIVAFLSQGFLGVAGTENPAPSRGRSVNLSIPNVTGPGTFSLGGGSGAEAIIGIGDGEWVADAVMGSGSVTIGTLTAGRATGTFHFVAEALTSTSAVGTKTITAGTFDVKL